MNCEAVNHFSLKYRLPMEKLPAKSSDRVSLSILLPGLLFSFLFVCMGFYDLFYDGHEANILFEEFSALEDGSNTYSSFINPWFFDIVVIVLGVGSIVSLLMSYIRYKKIIFDGKNVEIIYRPVLGKKSRINASLDSYAGVRFRIEFLQFGILNRNKYIVELCHAEPEKTIPLYISTSGKDVRKIWDFYVKKMKKPAIIHTDEGDIRFEYHEMGKSLRSQIKSGNLKDDYDFYAPLPDNVSYVRKRDKLVVKGHKIVWDAYNFVAWFFVFVFSGAYIVLLTQYNQLYARLGGGGTIGVYAGGLTVLLCAIWLLFRKEKLVIKKSKIVHTYKYMLFSTKHDEMNKADIEAVYIMINPVSGRRCLSIISGDKTIAFGKKLPLKDLQWVKKLLIHEVIS